MDNVRTLGTPAKQNNARDDRLSWLKELSKSLDGFGMGMVLTEARRLLVGSMLRATGVDHPRTVAAEISALARLLDEQALLGLTGQAMEVIRERCSDSKRADVILIDRARKSSAARDLL